ncbi:hypothetical protein [Companilactobacillus ginsenosidimutans]|uniref:Uncharacterized protein n=1 Tax=Companilactobacillus ginsenosidimutans TaxID=1007676 RepID=A0A0H4R1K0_9LACO|nr:hypothetical protein [Companilactobacillus ginsenosidimutans]AKP67610.1 hypothetical protein ABM34_08750 [Companilactobacillus ginsenosidimutans]
MKHKLVKHLILFSLVMPLTANAAYWGVPDINNGNYDQVHFAAANVAYDDNSKSIEMDPSYAPNIYSQLEEATNTR